MPVQDIGNLRAAMFHVVMLRNGWDLCLIEWVPKSIVRYSLSF